MNVSAPPVSISVKPLSTVLGIGEKKQITASVKSWELDKGYTYESSDSGIVKVDKSGMMEGVSSGSATITVTAYNGVTAKCSVSVLPYGWTKKDVEELRNVIKTDYEWVIFLNRFFDGGGSTPNGDYCEGVDIKKITDDIYQQAYATLFGGNGDVVLLDTVKAFTLADGIMSTLSEYKESKPSETIKKVKAEVKKLDELGDARENIVFLLGLWTDSEWDKYTTFNGAWDAYCDRFDDLTKGTGKRKETLQNLTIAKDALTTIEKTLVGMVKYMQYRQVPADKVRVYINQFRKTNDPSLKLTGELLESFISPEAPLVILGYYGIIPAAKQTAKALVKVLEISETVATNALYYAPAFVQMGTATKIGLEVGKAVNSVMFNIAYVAWPTLRSMWVARWPRNTAAGPRCQREPWNKCPGRWITSNAWICPCDQETKHPQTLFETSFSLHLYTAAGRFAGETAVAEIQ